MPGSGQVQTVLGAIAPEDLGPSSPHEHLLLDFTWVFKPPSDAEDESRAHQPVSMENLGWVNYDPFRSLDNLLTIDEDVAVSEAMLFRNAGGRTIVDVTSIGIGRDPLALARISRATGINVVMGAGYYVQQVHPDDMDDRTEDQIAREIVADVTDGVGDTGVKAGIIGELGCSWPLHANERKVLRAGARAQSETGAPLTIHPGRNERAPFEVLDVIEEAGADPSRTVMCHLDRTYYDVPTLLEFAKRGCYLEYDFFGWETSYFSYGANDMINDAQRLGYIKLLVDEGYADRVLIAHDMFGKHRQAKYGGHGFAHILENIVPRMRQKGFSDADIETITVRNPARVLKFE